MLPQNSNHKGEIPRPLFSNREYKSSKTERGTTQSLPNFSNSISTFSPSNSPDFRRACNRFAVAKQ